MSGNCLCCLIVALKLPFKYSKEFVGSHYSLG